MICPSDNAEMHQVIIKSHYGQPIFLEQCGVCGGIWFDESELYRAKQGEAKKIEQLDSETLWAQTLIQNEIHLCPKDQTKLFRFTDNNFPMEVFVERCPECNGFWLNRGEFTKYQKARQELMRPKEKTDQDKLLEENIRQMLAAYQAGKDDDVFRKLGQFLSKPVDETALGNFESKEHSTQMEKFDLLMGVLTTLFRLFVFK